MQHLHLADFGGIVHAGTLRGMASRGHPPPPGRCLRVDTVRQSGLGKSSFLIMWFIILMFTLRGALAVNIVEVWTEWDLNNYLSLIQGQSSI